MISEERLKDIRDNHTCYKRSGDCDQCDLLADRDELQKRIAALEEFAKKCVHSEWVKLHDDLLCIPLADALTRATANTGRTTK